jgi:hypothetical protein
MPNNGNYLLTKRRSIMKIKTLIKDLKEETISLDDVSTFYVYELITHFLNQCKVDEESEGIISQIDNWLIDSQGVMPEFDEYFSAYSTSARKETYGIVNN